MLAMVLALSVEKKNTLAKNYEMYLKVLFKMLNLLIITSYTHIEINSCMCGQEKP